MAMLYKPYGRTGKEISAVSFGGMRFADQDDIDEMVGQLRLDPAESPGKGEGGRGKGEGERRR